MFLVLTDRLYELSVDMRLQFEQLAILLGMKHNKVELTDPSQMQSLVDESDASILFLCIPSQSRVIQRYLNASRELRIPYVLINEQVREISLHSILSPVTFLEEEVEKSHYISFLSRHTQAAITLMLANDVGTRAKKNVDKYKEVFDKFDLPYKVELAKKDSFKVAREAALYSNVHKVGMLVILASRDYGLDDLLFGPPERNIIRKASVPIMLVNPRADLYALCN